MVFFHCEWREETNPSVLRRYADVTSEESILSFFSAAIKKFGRVDYACNLAGILISGATAEFSVSDFDKQFGINLRGMWMCEKAEIIQMLSQEPITSLDSTFPARGAIVNVASMAGLRGYDNLPSYCSTKYGIIGFTKADALKYAIDKIRINAICPGIISTPMLGELNDDDVASITKEMAMARQGLPEEIAEGILWVSSGRASFMTATTLALNGGMTLSYISFYNMKSTIGRLTSRPRHDWSIIE